MNRVYEKAAQLTRGIASECVLVSEPFDVLGSGYGRWMDRHGRSRLDFSRDDSKMQTMLPRACPQVRNR